MPPPETTNREPPETSHVSSAMSAGAGHKKLHAILVAYPLQGHVIPSVHLAIKLASKGFTITFVNTDSIHHKITAKAQNAAADDIFAAVRESGLDIRYATVPDGLPLQFDRSLNHDQFMAALLHVFSAHVEDAVAKIVPSADPPVNCLIADTFFVWPSTIAKKFGLLYVSFWTEPALVFTLYYHLRLLKGNGHFACQDVREDKIDYIPGVKAIEPRDLPSYLQDTDTSTVCHDIIRKAFEEAKSADLVLCNTAHALEPDTITALQAAVPFYAVGPVFRTVIANAAAVATSLWSESDCSQWLDGRPRGSVLYVSFGSYAHVTRRDLAEIAGGLSLSGASFVWVLRPDIVSSAEADPLPVGYMDSIRDRAMVIPWCRQIEVLSHPAIGGFLTHCGWNSILESIWCGVPMLCFPLLTDQFTNRMLVVDGWRIGIDVSDRDRAVVAREDVARNVRRLMGAGSGDEFRERIREIRERMGSTSASDDTSSDRNMNQFVVDLRGAVGRRQPT